MQDEKWKLEKLDDKPKNGQYFLVEYLGIPTIKLRDEGDWCDPLGGFADDTVDKGMKILAKVVKGTKNE